jgi:hypothetical protein
VLLLRLRDNPNIVKKQLDENAVAMLASPTVKDYKDALYDSEKMKSWNEYYLVEYSSVTQSLWGKVPLGFKRSYDLSQLISIQTKTAANSKGLTFKLIFQSQPPLSQTTSTVKNRPPPPSSFPSSSTAGATDAVGLATRTKENKPPLEQMHLMSYMNILQKNVPPPAAAVEEQTVPSIPENIIVRTQEGEKVLREVTKDDSNSMESFDQDVQQEFADIATGGDDYDDLVSNHFEEDEYYDYDEEEMLESQGENNPNNNNYSDYDDDSETSKNSLIDEDRLNSEKQHQIAATNAQREIHKILSQPINRRGSNKKKFPVLCLRATEPDERLKWVAALTAAAEPEVYINTLTY